MITPKRARLCEFHIRMMVFDVIFNDIYFVVDSKMRATLSLFHYIFLLLSLPNVHVTHSYLLSTRFDEMSSVLGGTGRARIFWNYLRKGENPLIQPITDVKL